MYESIRGLDVLEVGLFEVPRNELRHFLILVNDVLLLEQGNLLPNAVQ